MAAASRVRLTSQSRSQALKLNNKCINYRHTGFAHIYERRVPTISSTSTINKPYMYNNICFTIMQLAEYKTIVKIIIILRLLCMKMQTRETHA